MREREKVLGAALSEALGFVDAEARASLEEVAESGRLRPWRGAACAKKGASTKRAHPASGGTGTDPCRSLGAA